MIQFHSLSKRRFATRDMRSALRRDEHGFLDESIVASTLGVVDVINMTGAVLVLARPWVGKSYVAENLQHHLREHRGDRNRGAPFGRFSCATFFEQSGLPLLPTWWADWKKCQDRACWIIDAVDEDARREKKQMHEILDAVAELSPCELERLLLLMFARENEMPADIRERLTEIYSLREDDASHALHELLLAPLGASDARELLGSEQSFRRVCGLVLKNQLQSISDLPVVLNFLKTLTRGEVVATEDVWKGVLHSLFRDPRSDIAGRDDAPEAEYRFNAASRIAAVLLLSGSDEFADDNWHFKRPDISDIFPGSDPTMRDLRNASRFLRRTSIFQQTATGFRFAQHHTQEWLAAFGLKRLPLIRLKPMVADRDGRPFPRHRSMLSLLSGITEHNDVRDWITESYGGVVPRSDAAPWTLEQAVAALDRLQHLAKQAGTSLSLWCSDSVAELSTPGLGDILAGRIADAKLTDPERDTLIQVAGGAGAHEAADSIRDLIRDGRAGVDLRLSAAVILNQLGTNTQYESLAEWTKRVRPGRRAKNDLISAVILGLLERGIWSIRQALKYRPLPHERVGMTSLLDHRLKDEMTLEDARWLLEQIDWKRLEERTDQTKRPSRIPRQKASLHSMVEPAIEKICEQSELSTGDYFLLQPLILFKRQLPWQSRKIDELPGRFSESADARRQLFQDGVQRDPQDKQAGNWRWQCVLRKEDLDWLIALANANNQPSPWLWEQVLILAYKDSVTKKSRFRARGIVKRKHPEIVAKFDKGRKRYLAQQRHIEKRQQKWEDSKPEPFPLDKLVTDALDHPKITSQQQLHRLSWLCFTGDSIRPSNVVGTWQELDQAIKMRANKACEKALLACKPTPLPKDELFPASLIYEACAFTQIVLNSSSYHLDSVQIRKWLPGTLIYSTSWNADVMARCLDENREVTERILLAQIKRETKSSRGIISTAENLPEAFWSERLAKGVLGLVADKTIEVENRCTLLRVLAQRKPAVASATVHRWARIRNATRPGTCRRRDTGLNLLLSIDPQKALALLERFQQKGRQGVILEMTSLRSDYRNLEVRISSWSSPQIETLYRLLDKALPAKTDPQREAHVVYDVTPESELRTLRYELPGILFKRDDATSKLILEQLAGEHEEVREYHQWATAARKAGNVLSSASPMSRTPPTDQDVVPVSEVVRVLEDCRYRLIRSVDDLQVVILEELEQLAKNVKEHLSMLYRPKSESAKRKRGRKQLNEDAFQAYIFCRLNDRLPGRVLGDKARAVFINREPLAARDQQLDIKVEAPTVDGVRATVAIEMKWSDHKAVSTSQIGQLGQDYLLGANLTHGIYLVAWMGRGRWSGRAGSGPTPQTSIDAWKAALELQAGTFMESHPNLRLVPMLIDVRRD